MGVRSMTGCGAGAAERGGVRVEVRLSSVNRKGLDVLVGVPRGMGSLEAAVQRGVGARLARGRVTGEVRVDARGAGGAVAVDWALAGDVAKAGRELEERLGLGAAGRGLRVADVLAVPGVLAEADAGETAEKAEAALSEALGAALDELVAFREREGAALAEDLLGRVAALEGLRGELEGLAPGVGKAYEERLRKRIAELLAGAGLGAAGPETEERIVREVALFVDRADVTEELVRLRSHLAAMGEALRGDGAAGRRLDFLAQEAGREINTIGSKANDAEMTRRVVAFKTELERVREQIQNIE